MTSVGTVLRVAEFRRRLDNRATSNQFHHLNLCFGIPPPGNDSRLRALRVQALIKPMEMMDRSVAVADAEAVGGGDRGADPVLGLANGGFQVLAPGQAGRDG